MPHYCIYQLTCPIAQLRPFSLEEESWPPQALQERPVLSYTTSALSLELCVLSMTTIVQTSFCLHGCPLQPGPKMGQCSLLLGEIFFALLDIRLDGTTARFPASWAHFPMLVS